ncbi:YdeI/OmpD-associated family protein [Alicyclobacillus sp. ALC3]|uniref:YdeI/OmpD-associated family protein n=1 Tax=Alicyclobacillus sp. ALC3 TaxID=2796143 RepID=UPI0023794A4E|nr:YdeI family protein [Alicyclobacillus sp. ALC3]WDL95834.1 YdeI family protein [Alicyclobacillus sp. ALC3]
MTDSITNPKVDEFLRKSKTWRTEYETLRKIALDSGLTEEFKWMHPCYTFENKNVVLIHGFKDYCALLFHKGALMQDPAGILIQQTENVQAARQIRFTNIQEITDMEDILTAYIAEAVAVEKSGLTVNLKKTAEFTVPQELNDKFAEMPALKAAFETLTPGRQRAYILYFSQPKQSQTRVSRVEKCVPRILEGKGLND